MNRLLLLALWVPCAAWAQCSNLVVSVTYTTGAAAAATALGTTITAKVNDRFDLINAAYAASGINVTLVPNIAAAVRPPSDSAPMAAQYGWVKNSAYSWQSRTTAQASVSVHISATSWPGAMIEPAQPALPGNSVVAVPYDKIDSALEFAISKILGSGTGYRDRVRSLITHPDLGGASYCYHTRESAPSDPNTSVPFLSYWGVLPPVGSTPVAATHAATQGVSCEAFRVWYGGTPTFHTAAVEPGAGGAPYCVLRNDVGAQTAAGQIILTNPGGSATISPSECAEVAIDRYSTIGNMPGTPFLPIGNSTFNSVGAMNTHSLAVCSFKNTNVNLLDRAKGGFWSNLGSFLNSLF